MVDDDPPRVRLEQEVHPAAQYLTVAMNQLHWMLDQHAARIEEINEFRPEASCALHRIGSRHRPLSGCIADEGRGALDRVVAIWVDEFRGNRPMEGGSDLPHVTAANGDARSQYDNLACNGLLCGAGAGGAQALAKSSLGRGALEEPSWRERRRRGRLELDGATAYRAIRAEITRLVGEAKQLPVLVIDEAQHLRNDVLEDLRLLTNFALDAEHRLCLLLVGLTELRRRLAMAVHESLTQRLVVRHHLPGLDRSELDDYLTHRLRLAGCELPLFEPPAVEALFQAARGLPRLINRIAHYALSAAALDNARIVNPEHLQHAVEELRP